MINRVQRDIYQLLTNRTNLNIFISDDFKTGFEVKQIFDYLNIEVLLFPDFRAEKFDDLRSYKDEIFDIFIALDRYYSSDKKDRVPLIIPKATFQHSFPSKNLRKPIYLNFADEVDLNQFAKNLEFSGYQNSGIVQSRGEFTVKNSILDIFPINLDKPLRVTFSRDGFIDEIRYFSEVSQIRFGDELETVQISPAYFSFSEDRYLEILETIKDSEFNSISPDIQSFGLWFLEDNELSNLQSKTDIYTAETVPHTNNIFDIELEKVDKNQSYQKSNILLDELNRGDYIVHSEYGIGIFEEITKASTFGGVKDFFKIRYFGDNHLLLPIEKLNLLSRYISATGKIPKIDKLGKGGFYKKSEKIRESLSIIANYIAKLSAKRQLLIAPKISKVDLIELQNGAGFQYTEDQKTSIEILSENLNQNFPMDHLLIGDVGFGKTEVAINSIYSVIKSGYQIAFVVPTTLLAKQHFTSLKKRFEKYSINIAHIDKFVKLKIKRESIRMCQNGEIDILIGTHSILDFKFKNLGLLIIDEEHKFGVKQKSKLQGFYPNIHLLSMSATPIPRTLHQAISKLKTVSRLDTPPKDRVAVKTFLKEYDEVFIKDAILKELKRDGQVFYIFNSITAIENKRVQLLNILPHLKIIVLHSKIKASIMEDEILNFENGKYDILLSTTIIGTGIHIPNVNTIIIDSSDKFGVADLHQLRGRVGRGEREGYCFFFVDKISEISENASKRLIALEENSSLGSGSSLAMHDLEIRGGGNIVGENQSGHIDDIGYSLYTKILEEELKRIAFEGSSNSEKIESSKKGVDIQLSIEAYISKTLITEERVKLEIYRRVTNAINIDEVDLIENELKDRFGKLDTPASQFFDLIRIRIFSDKLKIKSVSNMKVKITITFLDGNRVSLVSPTKDDDDILITILEYLKNYIANYF